jgi:hypothetical protein
MIFVSVLDVQLGSEATSAVEQDGRFVLMRMLYDVHRATAVLIPAVAGQSASQLQLNIGGVTYTYAVNGNNLQLVNNLGTSQLNSFNTVVSDLAVNRVGDTVGISFTVTSQSLVKSFQTAVGLR